MRERRRKSCFLKGLKRAQEGHTMGKTKIPERNLSTLPKTWPLVMTEDRRCKQEKNGESDPGLVRGRAMTTLLSVAAGMKAHADGVGWGGNGPRCSQSKRGHGDSVNSRSPWVSRHVLSSKRAHGLHPLGLRSAERSKFFIKYRWSSMKMWD